MSTELPWFRFYHEFIADPVIRLLAFEDQRHFVMVLCMKARGDLDKLYPSPEVRDKVICAQLGLTPIFADEAKRRLMDVGLIDGDWQPLGWDRRQMRSDSSADRAKRYRDRKREQSVTSPSRDGHGLEGEREEEEEKDYPPQPSAETPPGGPTDASEPAGRREKASRADRATRLPDDFVLTPERRAIAVRERLRDPERVFRKFANHWRGKSGAAGRKVDWDATWENWCMSEHDRVSGVSGGAPPAAPDPKIRAEERARNEAETERRSTSAKARELGLDPQRDGESDRQFHNRVWDENLKRMRVPRGTSHAEPAPLSHSAVEQDD